MNPASLVELSDVTGSPKVWMTLPVPLRLGDRLRLGFHLRRQKGGRHEILEVSGDFRVTGISWDASQGPTRQILAVESTGRAPAWRAIRTPPSMPGRLGPTHFPPTVVS